MEDMSLHDVDEIIEGSDEEGEAMTAAHVLSKIEQVWNQIILTVTNLISWKFYLIYHYMVFNTLT